MVWIISRHYNRDERMVPLMARIAHDLSQRIRQAVDPKTIFRAPHLHRSNWSSSALSSSQDPNNASINSKTPLSTLTTPNLPLSLLIIAEAKSLAESWSEHYFTVRDRIEQSGRDQRWEFDRKKLFEQTNYMALRCGDLVEVVDVMCQFLSIFGPELKGKLIQRAFVFLESC